MRSLAEKILEKRQAVPQAAQESDLADLLDDEPEAVDLLDEPIGDVPAADPKELRRELIKKIFANR